MYRLYGYVGGERCVEIAQVFPNPKPGNEEPRTIDTPRDVSEDSILTQLYPAIRYIHIHIHSWNVGVGFFCRLEKSRVE